MGFTVFLIMINVIGFVLCLSRAVDPKETASTRRRAILWAIGCAIAVGLNVSVIK